MRKRLSLHLNFSKNTTMKTVELFSGTKSFSKVMAEHDHETLTIDASMEFHPDICVDILNWKQPQGLTNVDILWASPPCTAFSVASIGLNWTGGKNAYIPKTEKAELGIKLVKHTLDLIEWIDPKWWFIENPRGILRKLDLLPNLNRRTVTYCQYGDSRMKPTDIWTNAFWWNPRPICKNGDKCHVAAPRGSRTGTQGLSGAMERGRIPSQLFEEMLEQMPI